MEIFLLSAVTLTFLGAFYLLSAMKPNSQIATRIAILTIFMIWIWGFEESALGPKMLISSVVLFSCYAIIKDYFSVTSAVE